MNYINSSTMFCNYIARESIYYKSFHSSLLPYVVLDG